MRSLKGAVKLTALLHESCSPDLASIYTCRVSVTFSQPKQSMWPVIQMMLSHKLPTSVTTSHEWTKHMSSRFGNVMCAIDIQIYVSSNPVSFLFERILVG